MTRYKLLFVSAGIGAVALLGSSVVASSDRHESSEADEADQSETATTVQFEQSDGDSSRGRSQSTTRRESIKRNVDPIFRTP